MPQIRSYEAPQNLGLSPSETGVEATAGAARRIGGFYNQVSESYNTIASLKNDEGNRISGAIKDAGDVAVKYEDHQQISAGAASGAELFDSLSQSKDQAIKAIDPSDPQYGQKVEIALKQWRENNLAPSLDKFRDGFTTEKSQEWAEHFIDSTRNHMFVQSAADITSAASIGIKNSVNTAVTVASNTAMRDPSSVPQQLDLVEHSVTGMVSSSPVKGIDGAKIQSDLLNDARKQIVHAGAIGAIQKARDPEAEAEKWTKQYPDLIDGADAKQLAGNARQQIRARNYDFEQNRRRDKEITQDKSNEATSQYLVDVRSQDPKLANDPTAKKILNDQTLTKTDKNNLLNYIDRQLKPETDSRTSQTTFVGLLRDLRSPDANSDQVMQKAWDARLADPGKPGSMSEKDFNQFRVEVQARKTPEGAALETDRASFFKNYATAISGSPGNPNLGYSPQLGDPKVYNAEMDARRVEADLRKRNLDPHLAYDPSSQYFLGKPDRIAKWSSSMQQDLQTRATSPSGLPPAKDITGVEVVPAPVGTSAPRPAAAKPPEKGMVKDGYEFLGGSPGDARSWRKVEEKT